MVPPPMSTTIESGPLSTISPTIWPPPRVNTWSAPARPGSRAKERASACLMGFLKPAFTMRPRSSARQSRTAARARRPKARFPRESPRIRSRSAPTLRPTLVKEASMSDDRSTLTRRTLLGRGVQLTALAVAAGLVPAALVAAPPSQPRWKRCTNCSLLFYDGYKDNGRCVAGGGARRRAAVRLRAHLRRPRPAPDRGLALLPLLQGALLQRLPGEGHLPRPGRGATRPPGTTSSCPTTASRTGTSTRPGGSAPGARGSSMRLARTALPGGRPTRGRGLRVRAPAGRRL